MGQLRPPRQRSGHPGRMMREARTGHARMNMDTLARLIGCSKSHLSLMERGRRTISEQRARQIEEVLGIADGRLVAAVQWHATPPEVRRAVADTRDRSITLVSDLQRAIGSGDVEQLRRIVERTAANVEDPLPLTRRIPVINAIAAGSPVEFTDLGYPVSVADEYIACPDVTDPGAFAARVIGDSMEPDYREGEIVVFSPALPTPDGCDCFVRLERDAETTFKRVYFEDGGLTLRLQPLNEKYPPRRVNREDVAGLYAAAYVLRRVGR
jgi:repressor LexA